MRPAEARDLGALAGAAMAGTAEIAEDVHRAVAGRVPGTAGHDAIAWSVYGVVRDGLRLLGLAAGAAGALAADPAAPPLSDGRVAGGLLAALAAARGDALHRETSALAPVMTIRARDRDVPAEPGALAAAYPGAMGRLAMFVHGLGETERAWRIGARRPYAASLRRDLGITAVDVRYNTGLPVADNGRLLAALIEQLVAAWPVPVEEIALVGHSMGGLVARAAARAPCVTRVICLASPHGGAPLERGAELAVRALSRIPEAAPFARVVADRSAGIKDLRHGTDVPAAEGVAYRYITATVTGRREAALGRIVGDVLVRTASAAGGRAPLPAEHVRHVGGAHHLAVLNHPEVEAALREWLADRPR